MSWLSVQSLKKSFNEHVVLNDLHLELKRGERLAIAGETGSGKSTLLKIIAGLIQPDKGNVIFDGARVLGPEEKLLPGHDKIGYLSQHFELLNNYKVEEVLEMRTVVSPKEAEQIISLCEIGYLLKRKTTELSGGERQRVALARTLLANPTLLLLDEPFSNLDPGHKRLMKQTLQQVEQVLGVTTILVSHDGADLLSWASRILIVRKGAIVQEGVPEEVYHFPVNNYSAGLLGDYTLISHEDTQDVIDWAGLKANTPHVFIRPEQLRIVNNETGSLLSKVEGLYFMGVYYLLMVKVNQKLIAVKVNTNNYRRGQTVFLQRL